MKKLALTLLACLTLAWAGCETLNQVTELGTAIGVATGNISEDQASSINNFGKALADALAKLTPENEYYIGRAVMATVLVNYEPDTNKGLTHYVNTLGQSLALLSDKPETFGGYHFLVLDSEEINAFAAPGGLIVVTSGLVECCDTEDALAAVLAHEIGHVEKQHGLKSIKSGRFVNVLNTGVVAAGKTLGTEELAQATDALGEGVGDIVGTLVTSGYSRGTEYEADRAALQILKRAGYSQMALVAMLEKMKKNLVASRHDFAATHPPPELRIAEIEKHGPLTSKMPTPKRIERFEEAVAGL